jgi:head-tail adaptor
MGIGQRRFKGQINEVSKNNGFNKTEVLVPVGERWMSIIAASGTEIADNDKTTAIISHNIEMGYFSELTPSHCILLGDRRFNLVSVAHSDKKAWTKATAKEVLNTTYVSASVLLTEDGEAIEQ